MPAADRPRRDPNKPIKARTPEAPPKTNGSWSTSKVFTKSSAIITSEIQPFLLKCITGWDNYDLNEQRSIIASLPLSRRSYQTNPKTGKLECPLDAQFVASDLYLKRAAKRFQSDVENGYYTQTWQKQSRQAMKDRAEGLFDDFLKHHVEETFGDDQDPSHEHSVIDGDTVAQGSSKNSCASDDEWNSKRQAQKPQSAPQPVNNACQ